MRQRGLRHAVGAAVLCLATGCGSTVAVGTPVTNGPGTELGDTPAASPSTIDQDPGSPIGAPQGAQPDGVPAAVASSGTGTGTGGLRPTGGGSSGSKAPAPVGQALTTPLKVGVIYLTDGGASDAFALSGNSLSVTPEDAARALVAGFNTKGGVAGRRLDAVYVGFNSGSDNYNRDGAAACETFRTDSPVPVVLDLGVGSLGGFSACLDKAGIAHFSVGVETDLVGLSEQPLHVGTHQLSVDRAYVSAIQAVSASGYLTTTSRVGVVVDECADVLRGYSRSVLPALRRVTGVAPLEARVACSNGLSSAAGASSAISSAVLRFSDADVDRVLIISNFESIGLLLFARAAENQGYRPGYVLTSYAAAFVIGPQVGEQKRNLRGGGWRPSADVGDLSFPLASEKRCLSLAAAGGQNPPAGNDKGTIVVSCGPVLLLEAVLRRTGGATSASAVRAALDGLGSGLEMTNVVEGRSAITADRRDAPALVREFAWQASCECMRYISAARATS